MKILTNLRAGNLSLSYGDCNIRYVLAGQNEIIRMIFSAVRDKEWLTINPVIEEENIQSFEDSFIINLRCRYKSEEIDLIAYYIIEGTRDNSISLTMEAEALSTFEKNRIGICVLHPIEGCAGSNCLIGHTDGSVEQSVFPADISPDQVFRDIKSMEWVIKGINCRIDFEGDIFETEDQRNWTDASYKTYSTPLSIPWPATVEKGTRIFQKVTFQAAGDFEPVNTLNDSTVITIFPDEKLRIPSVGICRSSRSYPLTPNEIKLLRSAKFDHYRIDLHLCQSGWQFKAEEFFQEALDLGYRTEFALFFDDNVHQQINNFIDWYSRRHVPVANFLLYHRSCPSTPDILASEVIPLLRKINPDVKIATGTNANFAELNRNRPGETGNDCICYSIHPQEHASDNLTLIENLESQFHSVRSARNIAGNKKIIISPINIQRRFNANTSFIELPWKGTQMPPQVDSRMMSLFGASWTAGSLRCLCQAGADSITYYETAGERGIFQGDTDPSWPLQFPSEKGMIFPVFHVFRFLLNNKHLSLVRCTSSRPLIADCLALSDGKQGHLLLVNYTENKQKIKLECCSGLMRLRSLRSESYAEAADDNRWTGIKNEKIVKTQETFEIEPFSLNFMEGWLKH
ncbi:MAG: hypothetical protein JXR67_03185 [Bacteroidales bacterium]|nr:hypothetical protein [Bacteroidales bacterium]